VGGIELGLLNPYLGSIYALIAGILTSASPCSIAAVPLIVGHMAGSSVDSKTLDLLLFLTGMTLVQSAVGMVAGLLGQSLVLTVPWIRWISGLAFILGGLTYMGFIGRGNTCKVKLPLGESQPNGSLRRRLFASLGMGALYSPFGITLLYTSSFRNFGACDVKWFCG
jgi:cytochrome c biogenesis protein CcdA